MSCTLSPSQHELHRSETAKESWCLLHYLLCSVVPILQCLLEGDHMSGQASLGCFGTALVLSFRYALIER